MLHIEFARRHKGWSQATVGHLPTVRSRAGHFISEIERGVGLPTPDQDGNALPARSTYRSRRYFSPSSMPW